MGARCIHDQPARHPHSVGHAEAVNADFLDHAVHESSQCGPH